MQDPESMTNKQDENQGKNGLLKPFLLSSLLGLIIGIVVGYTHFLSESRDWGKTWDNYNDFVRHECFFSVGIIFAIIIFFWICIAVGTFIDKRKIK